MMQRIILTLPLLLAVIGPLFAEDDLPQEIQELLQDTNSSISEINTALDCLKEQLQLQLPQAINQGTLTQIQHLQLRRRQCCQRWRDQVKSHVREGEDALAWDAQDGTLGQLLADYAPPELIYIVPPELAVMKVHLHTRLPLPEASWEEILEAILTQIGVGVRKPHVWMRELFLLKDDLSQLPWLLSDRETLRALPKHERTAFFLASSGEDPQLLMQRLEPFVRNQTTCMVAMGDHLALIGPVGDVQELLKLNEFLCQLPAQRQYQLLNLNKTSPEEMAKLLTAVFELPQEQNGPKPTAPSGRLKIMPLDNLSRAILVVGSPEQLRRAEQVTRDLEGTITDPAAKTIYYYQCEHTPPDELAAVLERVYCMLRECAAGAADVEPPATSVNPRTCMDYNRPCWAPSPPVCPAGPVNPQPISAAVPAKQPLVSGGNNFIVDAKTGSILMVVEQRLLPQLQELTRKLDVPKRMVQLDVMLVERRVKNLARSGLNLLRIGSSASGDTATSVNFDGRPGAGLFEFLISRAKTCSTPAYDLVYNFLLNQEDVQINANPSVITVNQTPSTISLVEEISINNGAVSCCDGVGAVIQQSYVRAQYGITLVLTPTVHLPDRPWQPGIGSVTLDSNITFDTTRPHPSDRPDVVRRHIANQVRVADGETVILGGLRRRVAETDTEQIPFLGEIPILGKLFSSTKMDDHETEMFIFITPHIVLDPKEELRRLRQQELCKRPGDLPEFLVCIEQAKAREQRRLFARSVQLLTDQFPEQQSCNAPMRCNQ